MHGAGHRAMCLRIQGSGGEEVQVGKETVEYAVYGAPGELPNLPDLNAVAGDALVGISTSETPEDWHERWKHFHRPVLIEAPGARAGSSARVPSLRIRPPWEKPSIGPRGEVEEIVIDPGQAFGTGGHASTRLCLEMLLELAELGCRSGPLLDVGTGSGVLAIAAARLGFGPVLGLDNERESVEAARENARVNGVVIEARRFDLRTQTLPEASPAPEEARSTVVVANLLRPLLLELARKMPTPPAHLVAGGLLKDEVDEIANAFEEGLGVYERSRHHSGGWAAVWLSRRGSGTSQR